MEPKRTTILPIKPVTNTRMTQRQAWVVKASDEYIKRVDERRLITKGRKGNNLARKKQMERYTSFKEDTRVSALEKGFTMPSGYFALWFYVPHPKSWRKKKIKEMLYKPHETTPDWDNYIKAMFDALMPRKNKRAGEKGNDDRRIHCGAVFKVWVKPEEACIKILEYEEKEFNEAFKHGHPLYSDYIATS